MDMQTHLSTHLLIHSFNHPFNAFIHSFTPRTNRQSEPRRSFQESSSHKLEKNPTKRGKKRGREERNRGKIQLHGDSADNVTVYGQFGALLLGDDSQPRLGKGADAGGIATLDEMNAGAAPNDRSADFSLPLSTFECRVVAKRLRRPEAFFFKPRTHYLQPA